MITMILAVGAIDASDSGGGVGLIVALLICSALWRSLLYISDTTDDVCYAVDVCNLFSSLPVKHV